MSLSKKNTETRHFSSQQHDSSIAMNQSTNVSNKKIVRNKENINLFNEVSNLLQYYQSSNVLKKKTSLPTSIISPKKIVDELIMRQALQTRKTNSRQKVSVSQNMGQKNLSLSPIEAKKSIGKSQIQFRCTFHQNKKAKYFEVDQKIGSVFYCSECSVSKLLNGNVLYPVESYAGKQNSNRKRDNQSVSRANFWSVDENSLLSSSPFLGESVETFGSISDEADDKQRELRDFQKSVQTLSIECEQIISNTQEHTNYQSQYNTINTELQQLLYLINIQSTKMIQQLQTQSTVTTVKDIQIELNSILGDIQSNQHNILNNMQLKPFKFIMQKYKEKLKNYVQTINHCSQSRQLFELDDRLAKLLKVKKLLKSQFKLDHEEPEMLSTRRKLTGNVYISFENKEMFLAAQRASMHVKDEPDLVQIGEKCHLLESPNFIQN